MSPFGDRGKVVPKICGEIQGDLPCLFGVLRDQIIDAHHGVADEMRAHLEYVDAGALAGVFLSLLDHLIYLVGQEEDEHEKHSQRCPEYDQQ